MPHTQTLLLPGWQSWTPCRPSLLYSPPYIHSPFGETSWSVQLPRKHHLKPPARGWNSWSAFGKSISAAKILDNARLLSQYLKSPEYVVIDDGWTSWGNWNSASPAKFPQGLKPLVTHIKSLGLKTGLWLAPFLTYQTTPTKLRIFPYKYLIDLENPHVLRNLYQQIKIIIEDWGIDSLN